MVNLKVGDTVEILRRGFVVTGRSPIYVKEGDIKEIKEIYEEDRYHVHINFTDGTGGYDERSIFNRNFKLIKSAELEIILW